MSPLIRPTTCRNGCDSSDNLHAWDIDDSLSTRLMHPDDIRKIALEYYARVDTGDVDLIMRSFAPDARYARPGFAELHGHTELETFYSDVRPIARGRHEISSLVVESDCAAIQGIFQGQLRDGSHVEIRFADFMTIDEKGRIADRTTYFYSPGV